MLGVVLLLNYFLPDGAAACTRITNPRATSSQKLGPKHRIYFNTFFEQNISKPAPHSYFCFPVDAKQSALIHLSSSPCSSWIPLPTSFPVCLPKALLLSAFGTVIFPCEHIKQVGMHWDHLARGSIVTPLPSHSLSAWCHCCHTGAKTSWLHLLQTTGCLQTSLAGGYPKKGGCGKHPAGCELSVLDGEMQWQFLCEGTQCCTKLQLEPEPCSAEFR